jgi:protein O-mannosyl-transferase
MVEDRPGPGKHPAVLRSAPRKLTHESSSCMERPHGLKSGRVANLPDMAGNLWILECLGPRDSMSRAHQVMDSRNRGDARGKAGDRTRTAWLWIGLLLALSILPYANSLRNGYVFDDRLLVQENPVLKAPLDLWRLLTSPYWGSVALALLWRPVTILSFALGPPPGATSAVWPHLLNILLHAGVTLLWFRLIRRLFADKTVALVAAALFAVHPLHTEAVTWISGRAELLAAAFSLAALHLAHAERPWARWLTPLVVFLAVGSKESAALLPVILLFTHWVLRDKRSGPTLRLVLACVAPVVLYVTLRRLVLGTWSGPAPDPADNPMSGTGLFARMPTVLDCAGRYLGLTFWPAKLSADYSSPILRLVRTPTPYSMLGFIGLAGLVYLVLRHRDRPEGWGAGFTLLTYALASNLMVIIGTILAERLFYLPSAGALLIVAVGAVLLLRRRPSLLWPMRVLLAVALLAGGIRTWIRNDDYRDESSFYKAGSRTQPLSPKMQANVALVYNQAGEYQKGLDHAAEALRLDPTARNPRDTYAASLQALGRTEEALAFLRKDLEYDPMDQKIRLRTIRLLAEKGLKEEAYQVALAGVHAEPEQAVWYTEAARQAQTMGNYEAAFANWEQAMRRAPGATDVPIFYAFCLLQAGRPAQANEVYREALRRDPRSAMAMNGCAWTLLETGGSAEEAVEYARMAVARDPLPSYFDTLTRAELAAGNCRAALEAARAAARLDSTNADYKRQLQEVERRCGK